MLEPIKIIDVILQKSVYGNRSVYLVLDRMPERIYKKEGSRLTSCDSGFYDFLQIEGSGGDAFGGRKFDIQLDDGSSYHCHGQVWAVGPTEDLREKLCHVGIGTLDGLGKCYVFSGAQVEWSLVVEWLDANKPSRNYYKHDRKNDIEYWLDVWATFKNRPVCKKRAQKLKRRGVTLFRKDGCDVTWCPSFERRKAELLTRQAADAEPFDWREWWSANDINSKAS